VRCWTMMRFAAKGSGLLLGKTAATNGFRPLLVSPARPLQGDGSQDAFLSVARQLMGGVRMQLDRDRLNAFLGRMVDYLSGAAVRSD
jgi:hypothetical protein